MKIAFPTQKNNGLDSPVYTHFGSAPFFIIAETQSQVLETIANIDMEHDHGQCQPMKALGGRHVDAVVVGGIGGGALRKLNDQGIQVYRAVEGSIGENLGLIKAGKLPQFMMNMTCAGHDKDGGCIH